MVDSPPYIKIALALGLHSPKRLPPHTALDRGASRRQLERIALPSCPAPYWVQGLPIGTSRQHVLRRNITLMARKHKSTLRLPCLKPGICLSTGSRPRVKSRGSGLILSGARNPDLKIGVCLRPELRPRGAIERINR